MVEHACVIKMHDTTHDSAYCIVQQVIFGGASFRQKLKTAHKMYFVSPTHPTGMMQYDLAPFLCH